MMVEMVSFTTELQATRVELAGSCFTTVLEFGSLETTVQRSRARSSMAFAVVSLFL